jgi:hypothetical protein
MAGAAIWLVAVVLLVFAVYRSRRRKGRGAGSAGAGAVYDWLNQDKRNAVEIIVEGRAASHDPEDRDGNLPDLAGKQSRAPREPREPREP